MIMKSSVPVVALIALVVSRVQTFVSVGGSRNTHVNITGNAVMEKIREVCEAVAESEGRDFKPTGSSAEELLRACLGTATGEVSGAKFRTALNQIYMQNGFVDRDFMSSAPHHFNNEAFNEGRNLIIQGTAAIKANVRTDNLQSARETLGRVCHTLQDFYSHSNWVELGNKSPYANLIRPDLNIEKIADITMPTCSDCASGTCPNQLLPAILNGKYLTSGYMGLFSSDKPQGKCSHGGETDLSSSQNPRGGISKDEPRSHNTDQHNNAVNLAAEATLELLEDIRGAIGNKDYLRLMGIARSAVLVFVIDTTGSMTDDIAEAKRVAFNIIDSKKGTQDEPSEYILVPFNDPEFGPLIRTTDSDVMKSEISKIKADGGGDTPEMCLSGLQLALTGAPSSSFIYVFTDAPPKDTHLEKTINALIRSTKSTVSFFMTASRRRRRTLKASSQFQVYYDMALASGGQAIEVSKSSLSQATDIIVDTSTSALVTILQRSRDPGLVESFPFLLDKSVSNTTIYITGSSLTFNLRSPTGVTQSNTVDNGPLGTIQKVGNLQRIQLNGTEMGLWHIDMTTTQPYTIKVMGQSAITFIYDFVEEFKGPHPGFAAIDGRPSAGSPAKLLLTLTGEKGPEALELQEVALMEVSGVKVSNGTIEKMDGGDYFITVKEVPEGEFVVLLKGKDKTSSSLYQRQTTTQMSQSEVIIKAIADSSMLPGEVFKINFTVTTTGTSGAYTIRARNDKNIPMTHPSILNLVSGGSAQGTVSLTPPGNTVSGTDVTLTIEAEGPGGSDSNYAVLRLSVLSKVTDFSPPKCEIVGVQGTCYSSSCSSSNWELSVNITDGNGTGIESISIQQGSGDFTQREVEDGVIVFMGLYEASCCSPSVILSAVDKVGNVGRCSYTMKSSAGSRLISMSLPLWASLLLYGFLRDAFPL
ncbi:von Willebrand factor A domain-containing protein 7-like isoform X1 [Sinocyclocheilus anshuiensis]|uniref:von Willebrand factor A domain-containing protein 7-like n=2 Tax=Sinocyclocheilus anshuiensis TaxID=1608454 RepID=A0A671S8G5_9TELE|nr:PREDICTED: von Willebrand factor A domain-containing protein 7-like isoform X1 [Sinocyclocheilus anshuiensis]XP_016323696.1 PREDICTED: von Willebrand factor A domain-containing protein 7-like isoform X1 [Sinocyclocheilus anshuiensis]XP_016323698.1 PREDICTED: von Willebrand factor A domain-containing protein 7-like isoform X1 [Sinocyclocheilus anshuiensis]